MDEKRLAPLSTEFSTAALGDVRLTSRLMRIADLVAAAPGAGFPEQAGSAGELEGIYRFLANDKVSPEAVWIRRRPPPLACSGCKIARPPLSENPRRTSCPVVGVPSARLTDERRIKLRAGLAASCRPILFPRQAAKERFTWDRLQPSPP